MKAVLSGLPSEGPCLDPLQVESPNRLSVNIQGLKRVLPFIPSCQKWVHALVDMVSNYKDEKWEVHLLWLCPQLLPPVLPFHIMRLYGGGLAKFSPNGTATAFSARRRATRSLPAILSNSPRIVTVWVSCQWMWILL